MGRTKRTARDSGERRRSRSEGRRRRALLRGVWVVGVYLCWGVGLTWAVAWGVAWAAPPPEELRLRGVFEEDHQPARLARVFSGFGLTEVSVDSYAGQMSVVDFEIEFYTRSELPWYVEHAVPLSGDMSPTGPYFVAAYGWPWRALVFELWEQNVPSNRVGGMPDWEEGLRGAVVVPGGGLRRSPSIGGDDLYLPLLPLWRGLLANVLFYALVVLVLRRGFVLLRGRRRRRRGRCWAGGGCGYDLTGLDAATCPECGRPVAPTKSPQRQRRVGPGKGAG